MLLGLSVLAALGAEIILGLLGFITLIGIRPLWAVWAEIAAAALIVICGVPIGAALVDRGRPKLGLVVAWLPSIVVYVALSWFWLPFVVGPSWWAS